MSVLMIQVGPMSKMVNRPKWRWCIVEYAMHVVRHQVIALVVAQVLVETASTVSVEEALMACTYVSKGRVKHVAGTFLSKRIYVEVPGNLQKVNKTHEPPADCT